MWNPLANTAHNLLRATELFMHHGSAEHYQNIPIDPGPHIERPAEGNFATFWGKSSGPALKLVVSGHRILISYAISIFQKAKNTHEYSMGSW